MKTTAAETAKAIRTELKKAFPSVKFQVRSENYSMGDSVNIRYEDAIQAEKVEKLVKKYQYGKFNSMEDIYESSNVRKDIPQAKFIFVERSMSAETKARIAKKFENHVFDDYYGLDKAVRLEFQKMDIK